MSTLKISKDAKMFLLAQENAQPAQPFFDQIFKDATPTQWTIAVVALVITALLARALPNANAGAGVGCVTIIAGIAASIATADGFWVLVAIGIFILAAIFNGVTRQPEEFLRR